MKTQKIPYSQSNAELNEQSWRAYCSISQDIL